MIALQNEISPALQALSLMEFERLEKIYHLGTQKIHALRKINLRISFGEFTAVAGPSGSGKSTLLNLLSLVDSPTSGNIKYKGVDIKSLSDSQITKFRNSKIGIVFQNYNLIPVLNALENVALPLQIQSVSKKERLSRAASILNEVGLGSFLTNRPNQLSGGQRQRVAIARALVTNPEIVVADEPTAALDSKTGFEIINLMKELNSRKKTTFLFSTHDPRIIDNVNHVIRLEDGLIIN